MLTHSAAEIRIIYLNRLYNGKVSMTQTTAPANASCIPLYIREDCIKERMLNTIVDCLKEFMPSQMMNEGIQKLSNDILEGYG